MVRAPMVIGTACPYCSEKVILTLAGHTDDPQRLAVAANATCPGCGKNVAIGTAHVVTWRADGLMGESNDLAARRHWHSHCWKIY